MKETYPNHPPIELANRSGYSTYRQPGTIWMPELEIAHVLSSLRRISYDDLRQVRLRRHLLIIGPKGSCKSSVTRKFVEELSGAVDYATLDELGTGMPTYLRIDGGGVTWEKLRGGCTEGVMVMPIVHDLTYLTSYELFAFLGSGQRMSDKMDVLNSALEEGHVTISQIKMGSVSPAKKREFLDMCEGTPVNYNPDRNIMSYDVNCSMLACSRYLTEKQEKTLEESGFLSRFHKSEWRPSEEELDEYYLDKNGEDDSVADNKLKMFNYFLSKVRFERVEAPPIDMVNKVLAFYENNYNMVSVATGVAKSELRSSRDGNDIRQLLTAFAVMRQVYASIESGSDKTKFSKVEYDWMDVEAVMRFRDYHLDMVEERGIRSAEDDPIMERAIKGMVEYLKDPSKIDGRQIINTGDLAKNIMEQQKISKPAAYKRISKLREAGYLERISRGHARLGMLALRAADLLVDEEEVAHISEIIREETS